jgi:HD-GYP domain-containing protein (c-di-GMP phosphodiesterase class II)
VKVRVEELEEGCILENDIMGMTSNPIIPRNTVISSQHIEVLKSFLIHEVGVGKTKANGEPLRLNLTLDNSKEKNTVERILEKDPFITLYLSGVQQLKQEFQNWQSGLGVDITTIRNIILPLLKVFEENPIHIYKIHLYSTKEEYIYHHFLSVGLISAMVAKKLGYEGGNINQIALAGLLANCGMAKVRSSIITKQTALTEEEFNEIKQHTALSYKMVKDIPLLKPDMKLAIFQHHERIDGTGYPSGESNDRVHINSQIIAIADMYHAMVSERLYRSMQTPFIVLEKIKEDYFGKLDIKVVDALLELVANLSPRAIVKVSNGETGEVIFTNRDTLTRPLLKVVKTNKILDLKKRRDLHIKEVISI